jgi:hypothetical protein
MRGSGDLPMRGSGDLPSRGSGELPVRGSGDLPSRGGGDLPSLAPAAVPPPPFTDPLSDNTGSFGLLGDLNTAPRLDPATPPPSSRSSWGLTGEQPAATAYNGDPLTSPRATEGRRVTAIPRLSDMPREPQPPREADLTGDTTLSRDGGLAAHSRDAGRPRDAAHSHNVGLPGDSGLPRRGDHNLNGSSSDTMPLLNRGSRDSLPSRNGASSLDSPLNGSSEVTLPRQREGRVTPPWQADDLPVEPPGLRLVEPAPLTDPALAAERTYSDELSGEFRLDPPPLRLVEPERSADRGSRSRGRRSAERLDNAPISPPVTDEGDGDLLIFAAARSAWFTDYDTEDTASAEVSWGTQDVGWRAAEQASQPLIGDETNSGLPRRVPQQNLVPGSPVDAPERPLRIVRDAAAIAAHTTGYFRGWRRGQEVGGYSVGGRPGREQAGGWDFTRETSSREYQEREYEFRSARR